MAYADKGGDDCIAQSDFVVLHRSRAATIAVAASVRLGRIEHAGSIRGRTLGAASTLFAGRDVAIGGDRLSNPGRRADAAQPLVLARRRAVFRAWSGIQIVEGSRGAKSVPGKPGGRARSGCAAHWAAGSWSGAGRGARTTRTGARSGSVLALAFLVSTGGWLVNRMRGASAQLDRRAMKRISGRVCRAGTFEMRAALPRASAR